METSIRLPDATEQRLNELSRQTGRSKAEYLREFIEQGLDDAEDYQLASVVIEQVRKGEEPVHSAADVKKDLGLDD
ncbi:MAG: ribbon-helix-helix protein, CopG family [Gammaproteobacteria bacterium]|jgi:RHH-type rel operon transcriptional repressor/antitoxin RelB|nr:ribbon-helix-helix protein, CopG family [Gammaproteobacteria bacterium]